MKSGYYWAFRLDENGDRMFRSPDVVFLTMDHQLVEMGESGEVSTKGFENVGPVAPYGDAQG